MISFVDNYRSIELNQLYNKGPDSPMSQSTSLNIDMFGLTTSNSFDFELVPESSFEIISDTITLKKFYKPISNPSYPTFLEDTDKDRDYEIYCSPSAFGHIKQLRVSTNRFNYRNHTAERYQIRVCQSEGNLYLQFRRKMKNVFLKESSTMLHPNFPMDLKNEELKLVFYNNILKVYLIKKKSGEAIALFPFIIELYMQYMISNDFEQQSEEDQINAIHQEIDAICGDNFRVGIEGEPDPEFDEHQ